MQLTKQQSYVLNAEARFKVVVAGRRGGKSYMSIASLAQVASQPGKTCCFIAPTHGMAKQIIWKPLKAMLTDCGWVRKINASDMEIELINGSTIMLRSADNPDRMRGLSLSHAVLDEAADITPDTWFEVIRPALADQQGTALIISTPKGKGWLWDLFTKYKTEPEWFCHSYTTVEGGIVTPEEVEQAKSDLGEREFRQEFLAEWVEFAESIYYAFDDHNIQSRDVITDRRMPIYVGMDFNVNPGCALVAEYFNGHLHVYDEIEIYGTDTSEMAQEIQSRYPGRKVKAFPDAAGSARKTSAVGGITDHIILSNAGFELIVGKSNPPVKDRIAAVNRGFKSADGITRITIDPSCKKLIAGLRKHQYKPGTRQPEKDGAQDFSHFNDALGYLVYQTMPIQLDQKHHNRRISRVA